MKKLYFFLVLIPSLVLGQSYNKSFKDPMVAMSLEYMAGTKGIMPGFAFSTEAVKLGGTAKYFAGFFNLSFGPEKGYYNGPTKNSIIESYMQKNAEGDQLISYNYTGLDGKVAFSAALIPTFKFGYNEESRNEYTRQITYGSLISIGVGLKITRHGRTEGSYTTISRDDQYEYTAIQSYDFNPGFFDFSPIIQISGKRLGLHYSLQSVYDKSKHNHTFGFMYMF